MKSLLNQRDFNYVLRRAVLLPLAIFAVCPIILLFLGRHLVDITRWDRHSLEVLSASHAIEKLLIDLETGVRGYQLTGDEAFLEPYSQSEPHIAARFSNLEDLVRDNIEQRQKVQLVRRAHEVWSAYALQAMQSIKEGRPRDAAFIASGKPLMDRTRAEMAQFIAAENTLSETRAARVDPARHSLTAWAVGVFIAGALLTTLWTIRQIRALTRSYDRLLAEADQQTEWFRVTLGSIGDAVMVTDRNGKVVFMNAEAERLTGWEFPEAKGKPLRAIFHIVNEETRETVDDPVEKVFRENRVVGLANHTVLISKRGPEWMIEDSAAPIFDRERTITGVVLVFQDATARRRAQKELQKAHDAALAASRAKDIFIATLSHELRTPLNPVLLLASEGAANEALPASVREDFDTIAKNALVETRLIDDLLDVTKIARGKMSLDLVPVHVESVVRHAVATVETEAAEKGLTLTITWPAVEDTVLGDSARLQQVFWNLLRNAIKFTPSGGSIRIVAATAPRDGRITITVTDTGVGMTRDEIARVFESFSQGDHAAGGNSAQYGGLGLGLYIARRIVELHRGEIQAESAGPRQGTMFSVMLPLTRSHLEATPEPPREPVPAAPNGPPANGRCVLVVDDHEPTRSTLVDLLTRRDFTVASEASVTRALAVAAAQRLDLVVSDIGLPDGDGYELMTLLRERYGLAGIALSGYGTEADIARSRAAGFACHLTKPISVQELDTALAAVLPTRPTRIGS